MAKEHFAGPFLSWYILALQAKLADYWWFLLGVLNLMTLLEKYTVYIKYDFDECL